MRVAVIILNWNKADLTRRCLAIAQSSTKLSVDWIVVDNASTEQLGAMPANVTVIQNKQNVGFTGGMNAGLRRAMARGAEYAWLLNNDVECVPLALDLLVEAMNADPRIGLASPLILNSERGDEVDFAGGYTERGVSITTNSIEEYLKWRRETPECVWLVGTALLVRRTVVEKIGYLNDTLFAYHEDNEISRRATAAGFLNVVVIEAKVRHPSGKEGDVIRPPYYYYFLVRNDFLVLRELRDPVKAWYWALRRHWRWYRNRAVPARCRRAIRLGMIHGLIGRAGPMPARL